MLSFKETNAIGQILNNSWGESKSIDYNLQNDILVLKYQVIVHFASERSLQVQSTSLAQESADILKEAQSDLKKRFKELTGNTLKLTQRADRDNIELVSATSVNPRKIAYYRRFVEYVVEN